MEESNVFVNGLAKAIGLWQGVVPCDEIKDWICSEVSGSINKSNARTEKL